MTKKTDMDKSKETDKFHGTNEDSKEFIKHLNAILELLRKKEGGACMNDIIEYVKSKCNAALSIGDIHELFRKLSRYACDYKFQKWNNSYILTNKSWHIPVTINLSHMDLIALRIGWEALVASMGKPAEGEESRMLDMQAKTMEKLDKSPKLDTPEFSSMKLNLAEDLIAPDTKFHSRNEQTFIDLSVALKFARPVLMAVEDADGKSDTSEGMYWVKGLELGAKGWSVTLADYTNGSTPDTAEKLKTYPLSRVSVSRVIF